MKTRSCLLSVVLLFVGCGQPGTAPTAPAPGSELHVAVAASMRYAFEDVVVALAAEHPEIKVKPNFGASGAFFAQISQGAPLDLFLSADMEYPEKLAAEGHAETPFAYATGRLCLWAPKSAGLDLAGRGMEALGDPGIVKIAIANPDTAPYGRAALEALRHYHLLAAVETKLVRGENIGQAGQFVQSGGAQAGLIAYSLTFVEAMKGGDLWLVPEDWHEPLAQGGAITKQCRDPGAAALVQAFLTGEKGQEILARHGFGKPGRGS